MKKIREELTKLEKVRVKNMRAANYWDKNIGNVSTSLFRTDYFLCCNDEILKDEKLIKYHDDNPEIIYSYCGYRGNMTDCFFYYILSNIAMKKGRLDIDITEQELLKEAKIDPKNTRRRDSVRNSLRKLAKTSIFVDDGEYIYGGNILGRVILPSNKNEEAYTRRIYSFDFDSALGFYLEKKYSHIKNEELFACLSSPIQLRLYFYLAANIDNPWLSLKELFSMLNPYADSRILLNNLKQRALPELVQKGIIAGYTLTKKQIKFQYKNKILTFVKEPVISACG